MTEPPEMTSCDLRALAQLVDEHKVVVVRHENLLAVLRPETSASTRVAPRSIER